MGIFQPVDQQAEHAVQGHEEDAVNPQVSPGGNFQGAGLAGFLQSARAGAVGDGEPVEDAVGGHDDAGGGDGPAPAVRAAEELQGDGGNGNGGGGGTEVAPAGVEAFGKADVFRLKPEGGHVNADDEAAAHQGHEQAGDEQLGAAFTEGEEPGGYGHDYQQNGEGAPRPVVVENHADDDAAGNG